MIKTNRYCPQCKRETPHVDYTRTTSQLNKYDYSRCKEKNKYNKVCNKVINV